VGQNIAGQKSQKYFFLNPDNGKGWVRTPPMDALVVKIDHFRARVMTNIAFLIISFFFYISLPVFINKP
jgi:hypothetical protein